MSGDPIPAERIGFQSLQAVTEGTVESDLLHVLEKRLTEQTPAGPSVNGDEAIVQVSYVMIRLLIGHTPKRQREILDAIGKRAREIRLQALAASQKGGTA